MDAEIRQKRARLVRHLTVQIHDSEAKCPPLAAMWIAILTGVTAAQIEEGGLSATVSMKSENLAPVDINMSPFFWDNSPQWLGLDPEQAMEMLCPEGENADWRAKPDTDGYISVRSIRKMLDVYAETGAVKWPSRKDVAGSWESVCEEYGIQWAAWKAGPIKGWREPGTERIAIVKFREGQKAPLAEFNLAEQFSDLAGYEVYVTNLERIDDRYREAELRKAERFYGRLQ
ncbi:MAG: hypothetical protein F4X65_06180 [Chloroflexi bacterium]|nr:hypothetical protein [Chloroflexota bacterium]